VKPESLNQNENKPLRKAGSLNQNKTKLSSETKRKTKRKRKTKKDESKIKTFLFTDSSFPLAKKN
jgi:hypothetical protein